MLADSIVAGIGILVAVTTFTVGFFLLRIHDEQRAVFERRDAAEDHLRSATAAHQPLAALIVPRGRELGLATADRHLLGLNLTTLVLIVFLEILAGLDAGWRWTSNPAPAFWMFLGIDVVELLLIAVAIVGWRSIRQSVVDDYDRRPWAVLASARSGLQRALDSRGKERFDHLLCVRSNLLSLDQRWPTWVEPIEFAVLADWLEGGATLAAIRGEQERLVALQPDNIGALLSFAHILTCADVDSREQRDAWLGLARSAAEKASSTADSGWSTQNTKAAAREALGDVDLVSHAWQAARDAYHAGAGTTAVVPPHHQMRCQVKEALAILGQRATSAEGTSTLEHAETLLRSVAGIVTTDAWGKVHEESPVGLQAGIAVAQLLNGHGQAARTTISDALQHAEGSATGPYPAATLETIHLQLVRYLVEIEAANASSNEDDIRDIDSAVSRMHVELQGVPLADEIEYVPDILSSISLGLRAECHRRLEGETSGVVERFRHEARRDLLSDREAFSPLFVLLAGWAILEVNNQGFFQSVEERRMALGPRYLEREFHELADPVLLHAALSGR